MSAGLDTSATEIDAESAGPPGTPDRAANPDRAPMAGSLIPRPKHLVDGILVIDSPLTTEYQGREYLQTRRQLGGFALPDTTAALNQGGSGTSSLLLRLQPTLILLNGRRLVTAPYSARRGADYVDINQLPITLIDHVEFSKGLSAAFHEVQFQAEVRRTHPLSLKLTRIGGSPILDGLVRALRGLAAA